MDSMGQMQAAKHSVSILDWAALLSRQPGGLPCWDEWGWECTGQVQVAEQYKWGCTATRADSCAVAWGWRLRWIKGIG